MRSMINVTTRKFIAALSIGVTLLCLPAVQLHAQMDVSIGLRGTVTDETNRKAAALTITVNDPSGKKITSTKSKSSDGSYFVVLKPGAAYSFTFEGPGYFREVRTIEVPPFKKYTEITRDWLVHPNNPGVKLRPAVSPFEYKKTKLRIGSELVLAPYLALMKSNPGTVFEIQCFPDVEITQQSAADFTNNRANTLKNFFVSNGISAERISAKGSSGIDPENPIPQGRAAKGRRYVGSTYLVVMHNE